ncbi:ABC transporter ATP-binding protein [Marinigracilibium pacificum]|uniref:ABC transporter ATP-binding protein n=1 Tax=Marinigracilibium pacificum TaxID=2729599 RepID=A0A848J311_9BACT|nr:ABC transporter ATP-binding protein [Marinigracilibium pacificum]NMM48874.1 ABC transporter ATP-binding protein [Marinigracilibium pacificum]
MLEVKEISKKYSGTVILDHVSFALEPNTTFSVLGKSGGGKTTLLKIIAGLTNPDGGSLQYNGVNINNTPPEKRNIVYLYQEPLLFPHLTVKGNLEFPLKLKKSFSSSEMERRINEIADELSVSEHLHKYPEQLSGGQKQRVNFGRALLADPGILLLDEPFGNLDVQTRADMQSFYKRVAHEHQITSVFVTHDLKEAIIMGNRYGYLDKGKLKEYTSIDEMQNDEKSGLQNEINFWKELGK